jgi:hypothetical protein
MLAMWPPDRAGSGPDDHHFGEVVCRLCVIRKTKRRKICKTGFLLRVVACKRRAMSNSDSVIRKKRGRPAIGQTPVVSFRLDQDWQEAIDEWRISEPEKPTRSQAIRLLIAMGLFAADAERKQAARQSAQ